MINFSRIKSLVYHYANDQRWRWREEENIIFLAFAADYYRTKGEKKNSKEKTFKRFVKRRYFIKNVTFQILLNNPYFVFVWCHRFQSSSIDAIFFFPFRFCSKQKQQAGNFFFLADFLMAVFSPVFSTRHVHFICLVREMPFKYIKESEIGKIA